MEVNDCFDLRIVVRVHGLTLDPPLSDLLDIVGQDWMGWQDDALPNADALVNLCGGYTEQRVLATERLVGESLRLNPTILQVTVSPKDEEMKLIAPLVYRPVAIPRLKHCEDLVSANCPNFELMRLEVRTEILPGPELWQYCLIHSSICFSGEHD